MLVTAGGTCLADENAEKVDDPDGIGFWKDEKEGKDDWLWEKEKVKLGGGLGVKVCAVVTGVVVVDVVSGDVWNKEERVESKIEWSAKPIRSSTSARSTDRSSSGWRSRMSSASGVIISRWLIFFKKRIKKKQWNIFTKIAGLFLVWKESFFLIIRNSYYNLFTAGKLLTWPNGLLLKS